MWNPLRRKPKVEATVLITKKLPADVAGVMQRHQNFVGLCMRTGVDVVKSSPNGQITVRGTEKQVAFFKNAFTALDAANQV